MNCGSCNFENKDGSRFCAECGGALRPPECPRCQATVSPGASFCSQCGRGLTSAPASPEALRERRQLSVMFCDLVGSTPLANQLDAEELAQVFSEYQAACSRVVDSLGGRVAQYLGDGILAYFGHPLAHEDDAVRAVTAGVGILDALPEVNAHLSERLPALADHPIHVRIGVHTGRVVVGSVEPGDGEGADHLAVGDTVHVASRLEGLAAPNSVIISGATYNLVRGRFVTEYVGLKSLEGMRQATHVHRVLRPSGVSSRLAIAGSTGLTELVGREAELTLTGDRWERVKTGHGWAVALCGEAGIGKSRVTHALHERLTREHHTWIECHCSPYEQNSAFFPVVQFVEQVLRIRREDPPETQIAALEEATARAQLSIDEVLPLFASLMSIELPDEHATSRVDPAEMRHRTLNWLTAWLVGTARRQPTVIVVEDLHWCDPSTLELVSRMLEHATELPLLFLFTYRPEFRLPWTAAEQISLPPLTPDQSASMVGAIAGKALPEEWLQEMAARTDGVPLFVEELTRSVLESEEARAPGAGVPDIPSTIQDSLTARLDRLGPAKEIAQLASVLGRSFSHELLAAIAPLSPDALEATETELVESGLLYRTTTATGHGFAFKHALVRDAAYQSLLRGVRRTMHADVANVLEQRFPEFATAQPATVALHCEEGGLIDRAVAHYRSAGERAIEHSANEEATRHLRRAVSLVTEQPHTVERDRVELDLQIALSVPLIAQHGYGDPQVAEVYARANELSPQAEDPATQFRVLNGLATYCQARADLDGAVRHGEQCLLLAEKQQNAALRIVSHGRLGLSHYYGGRPADAFKHLREATALYDPAEHAPLAAVWGQDLGVVANIYLGITHAAAGPPGAARESIRAAVDHAREIKHPHSLAFATGFAGVASQMAQDRDAVRGYAEEAIALGEDRGFPLWRSFGRVLLGWSESVSGTDGIGMMTAALEEMSVMGTIVGGPFFLSLLAEAQWQRGYDDEALTTLANALGFSRLNRCAYWESELLRLEGEIRGARGETGALPALEQAVEVASAQGCQMLELRATTSVARQLAEAGRREEARERLTAHVDAFDTEAESQDLRNARDVLRTL